MSQPRRSEDVASEPHMARGDDANGPSEALNLLCNFVSKKMVAIHRMICSSVNLFFMARVPSLGKKYDTNL